MATVVADLVAKIRADTTELKQGTDAAKQQLQGVQAQAEQTARALEIMAGQYAKLHGGTSAGALEMFNRAGVQPTSAALSQAAAEAEKTAAAHQETAKAAERTSAAVSATLTPTRTATAVAVEHSKGWSASESSIVRFGAALVGVNLGISLVAGAARLLHNEITASVTAAIELDRVGRTLAATYGAGAGQASSFAQAFAPQAGVTLTTAERALSAASPLARQYGLTTPQVQQLTTRAADLAGQYGQPFEKTFGDVLAGVQSGGNQLEQYGVRLDDVYVKTIAYNGALSGTYDRMTQVQQVGERFRLFMDQTKSSQGDAAAAANTLSGSLDRLGAAFQRVREQSGPAFTGPLQGGANALTAWLSQFTGGTTGAERHPIVADPNAPGGARILTGPPQFDLSGIPGLTATTPPSFIGPVPLRGADLFAMQAENAQNLAGRGQAEAQAQITALQLQTEQRRLNVAEELAQYRKDALDAESKLAPLLLQEATLQDRITVASRDNLQTRRALIQAEQAALPSSAALSAVDYEQRRLELRAEVSRAAVRRGGAPTEDISALRQQYRGYEVGRPDLELQHLDAQRRVEVIGQQRTGEQLGRDLALTNLEEQRRSLEDQTIPMREQLRLTQDREASVQRSLQLQDLANTKTLIAAQQALNEANVVKLIADETARLAADYSDHMVLGATALERSASALQAARDAINEAAPMIRQLIQPEVSSRLANGLGAGGLGPTAGSGITLILVRANDPAGVKQEIGAAIDQLLAGAATTGAPAPSTVGGAGR